MTTANGVDQPIIIKKYANRRLYDTSTSAYVTLEHLSALVREGKDFAVQDAKTGEDLTRTVLAQIIFEQENRKEGVLPVSFLRQLIQFYGDSFQSMLPAYLELSMKSFAQQHLKWREYMQTALGDSEKAKAFDDQVRKNMEMFEEAMRFFTPFVPRPRPDEAPAGGESADPAAAKPSQATASPSPLPAMAGFEAIQAMQKQMFDMQRQIAQLAGLTGEPPSPTAPDKDKG
ncbi:MAG: polyhydroxyalkanoate synthesis repressor PhaR [Hyphomonadaceae bacterium]